MVPARLERSRSLVLVALVLVAAWITVGHRPDPGAPPSAAVGSLGQAGYHDGVVTLPEVNDSVVTPPLASARSADARVLALWVLPGIVAALATLIRLRALRLGPVLAARVRLRGAIAGRAPPLALSA